MADKDIFEILVNQRLPRIAQHLNRLSVPASLIALSWFLCLFIGFTPVQVLHFISQCMHASTYGKLIWYWQQLRPPWEYWIVFSYMVAIFFFLLVLQLWVSMNSDYWIQTATQNFSRFEYCSKFPFSPCNRYWITETTTAMICSDLPSVQRVRWMLQRSLSSVMHTRLNES